VFVRLEVIISEARGDANWMFGQDSRSLRTGAKVAVSWEGARRSGAAVAFSAAFLQAEESLLTGPKVSAT
jgi:hypothetical protein